MCGIVGIVSEKSVSGIDDVLKSMTEMIAHRGPDGSHMEIYDAGFQNVCFGHRRLAILDLSESGKQPMMFENLFITYNGEIYNFKEIRQELISVGYTFFSESDTEVLLKGFHYWGANICTRLKGMFAFAIFDKSKREIFLARDRLGVKPLFYFYDGQKLLFASELKAILQVCRGSLKLNHATTAAFLTRGWSSGDETVVENVLHVLPAQIVRFNLDKLASPQKSFYWHPTLNPELDTESSTNFKSLLSDAIALRLISDVEVGCFLSGGIDSSLVAALASMQMESQLKTFSIKFENPQFDESERARYVASLIGADHQEFVFDPVYALKKIPQIVDVADELFNDWSSLPMLLLAEQVSSELKVVLSGDGGDEFFYGYEKYFKVYELLNKPIRTKVGLTLRKLLHILLSPFRGIPVVESICGSIDYQASVMGQRHVTRLLEKMNNYFGPDQQNAVFTPHAIMISQNFIVDADEELSLSQTARMTDINNYLPSNILPKVDRTTMAFGLEAREPLLDHRLLEYALRLPHENLAPVRPGKLPLKNMLAKILPQYPFDDGKRGFSVPLGAWMRNELRDFVMSSFTVAVIKGDPLLNHRGLLSYVDRFMKHGVGNPKFIWGTMMYLKWKVKWGVAP